MTELGWTSDEARSAWLVLRRARIRGLNLHRRGCAQGVEMTGSGRSVEVYPRRLLETVHSSRAYKGAPVRCSAPRFCKRR
ncbi:hypothetical protein HRbin30_02351 [bacterium HR30]|nr:hypothetical protein HRbin30_02351 [bacterium HR30]